VLRQHAQFRIAIRGSSALVAPAQDVARALARAGGGRVWFADGDWYLPGE
jgi:hypothetical protein